MELFKRIDINKLMTTTFLELYSYTNKDLIKLTKKINSYSGKTNSENIENRKELVDEYIEEDFIELALIQFKKILISIYVDLLPYEELQEDIETIEINKLINEISRLLDLNNFHANYETLFRIFIEYFRIILNQIYRINFFKIETANKLFDAEVQLLNFNDWEKNILIPTNSFIEDEENLDLFRVIEKYVKGFDYVDIISGEDFSVSYDSTECIKTISLDQKESNLVNLIQLTNYLKLKYYIADDLYKYNIYDQDNEEIL